MRALTISLTLSTCGLLAGCSLFPRGVGPPDSIFSDTSLGERRVPFSSLITREAQRVAAQDREQATRALDAISRAQNDPDRARASQRHKELDSIATTSKAYADRRVQQTQRNRVETVQGSDDPGVIADGFERDLVNAWYRLEETTNEANDSRTLLTAGIALVDHRCGVYFRALGHAAQKSAFASRELGLTTGVVAGLQGLTGVASKDIAIVASTLGFLSASSQAYSDVFIFSPDVGSVETLVLHAQQAVKNRIREMADPEFSKPAAIGLLQSYEKTCEVKTIRRLINESLSSANPIAGFQSDDAATVIERYARATIAKLLGVGAITDEQLAALYWLSYRPELSPNANETAYLRSLLASFPRLLTAGGALKPQPSLDVELAGVKAALVPLVALGTSQLDLRVAAIKGAVSSGKAQVPAALAFPPSVILKISPSQLTVR